MNKEELKNKIETYLNNKPESEKSVKDKDIISEVIDLFTEEYNLLKSNEKNNFYKQKCNLIYYDLLEPPVCECGNKLDFVGKDKASLYITSLGGWRTFCSRICMQKSKTTVTKRQQTTLEKFGEISYAKTATFKEQFSVEWPEEKKENYNKKRKITSQEKYGVDHYSKTEEYLTKRTETCKELYGVENTFQLKEKVIEGQKKVFGGNVSWLQTETGKEYMKHNHPMKNADIVYKTKIKRYISNWENVPKDFLECIIEKHKDEFIRIMDILFVKFDKDKRKIAEHLFIGYSSLCRFIRNFDLRERYSSPKGSPSAAEKEVVEFIRSLKVNLIHGDRTFLGNKQELDIFIPDYNLAIEYNGIYYHSEFTGDKDLTYHLNKTNICETKNVQLLHIFETEWLDPVKQEIWKSIIKCKLGLIKKSIFARKCIIKEISSKQAKEFLEQNHLQGFIGAKYHKGLFFEENLVSVMSIGESRFSKNEYEIIRFASLKNYIVVGGLSKLFKSFVLDKPIISFADRRYSSCLNSCYSKVFSRNKISKPSWYGFHKSDYILQHRLSFTKQKLKLLFNYNVLKSPFDNMVDNGYDRIWDCGSIKYFN